MNRHLTATLLAVVLATPVFADLGPRPGGPIPNAIPMNNVLKFGNEFPNYTFWAITVGQNGTNVVTLKADTSKPLPILMKLTNSAVVYAVPNDVAKLFDTPKEFMQAVATGKLPAGVVASPTLVKSELAPATDKRTVINRLIVVVGGLKSGVAFGEEDPLPKVGPREPEPEPEPQPTADARPAPRLMAVGVASALAVLFGGLWLARRGK